MNWYYYYFIYPSLFHDLLLVYNAYYINWKARILGQIGSNMHEIETDNAVKMTTLVVYWLFCHGALKLDDLASLFATFVFFNISSIYW